ncbi:hypothetical protein AVEN_97677-1 [Araneus ventricosus]|uniref:Uncharacterized protein n=1 Tax=Araneus ventricosus TaxID=182803 RepID=A0A4Y2GXD2_ARAVE|nr:hypothetical protein AVEN_97677-1 [Araneus ventricosus]
MLGRQETSSQIGKSSGSGIGVHLQVRSQMRVGVICVINDDVALISLYSVLTIDQRRLTSMDQRRVSFSSMESDQEEFDDFSTPTYNENAAELQSEWKIDNSVWDEAPSTSSGYRGPASPEMRSQHFILEAVDEFIRRGSGWILDKIVHFELCAAKYQPLRASSYIILPKKLVDKKAVLNIQNEDQKCLVWCLNAHKLNILAHDSYRASHYTPHEQEITLDGVECPVPLNKIPVVERLNNLRINVFGYEENEVFPLYVSKCVDEECVNLLLIANDETQHYCLIRNMSRLLGYLTKHKTKHHYCYRCPHRFAMSKYWKNIFNIVVITLLNISRCMRRGKILSNS